MRQVRQGTDRTIVPPGGEETREADCSEAYRSRSRGIGLNLLFIKML